jgi:hypothetical protein
MDNIQNNINVYYNTSSIKIIWNLLLFISERKYCILSD